MMHTQQTSHATAQGQLQSLEEEMRKVLNLIDKHPEWYQQERAERMDNILRELLRL